MNRNSRPIGYSCRVAVCVLLTLNLHVWQAGCDVGGPMLLQEGWMRLDVSSGQSLKSVVQPSTFAGVSAVEVNPSTGQFRLVLPDAGRRVSGSYALVGGQPMVTTVEFEARSLAVAFHFDAFRRITLVTSSTGQRWSPDELIAEPLFGSQASGVDAYIAANANIVSQVRQVDDAGVQPTGGGSTGGSGGGGGLPGFQAGAKQIASAQEVPGDISSLLGILGGILALQAAVAGFPVLYFVFQVVVAVNLTMSVLGGSATTGGGTQSAGPVTGEAKVRVINNLTSGVPIWYVVLVQDPTTGAAGSNLLGDEAIPAGGERTFSVPSGVRNFNIITPLGTECHRIYRKNGIGLQANLQVDLVVSDSDVGEIYPDGCNPG